MTCLDAAYTILKAADEPLHREESAARIDAGPHLALRLDARRNDGL